MALDSKGTNPDLIKIVADPPQTFPVNLVGKDYLVHPPKTSLAIKLARAAQAGGQDPQELMEGMLQWMSGAFSKKDATAIQKRLNSPEDDLDIKHIIQLMHVLIERESGNPTT